MANFAWSFSSLKDFETCSWKYNAYSVAKTFPYVETEDRKWGKQVHKALELYVRDGTPLPMGMGHFAKYALPFRQSKLAGSAEVAVELRWGVTRDLQPCDFWDANVWHRGQLDVVGVNGDIAILGDYKTGKPRPEPLQLECGAAVVMAHMPQVTQVKGIFYWLTGAAAPDAFDFHSEAMPAFWTAMRKRADRMERAVANKIFTKQSNFLCQNYCGVRTCEYHGHRFQ